jgi:thiosulfate reductase cytochrome b subunit
MKTIVRKHPLAFRWMHWINFPVLAVMVWSGLLIYWANGVYRIGWGSTTILKFFPKSFYQALHVPFRLGEGMSFHFAFMWVFTINGFLYLLFLIFSGQWRRLAPLRTDWKEAWGVVLHDLYLKRQAPPMRGDYNAAQRIAYSAVVIMGAGSILTGWVMYKPVQLWWLCTALGGYSAARIEHFILTLLFTLFFVVHVLQVVRAGWNNFRSMITGFEVAPDITTNDNPGSNTR